MYLCPCCNNYTMKHKEAEYHDICPVCFWENDPIQNENENYAGGANKICLKQARQNYDEFGAVEKHLIKFTQKDLPKI